MAMERLETLLAQWRSTEPETIEIDIIQTDLAYQPRNIILVPFKDRGKEERASEQHTADLAARLECGGNLEPVLVARIDGMLMLIDGHHRLGAYQKAGRTHIPARIRDSTKRQAFVVSKAANCDGVKLRMHNEQRREGAWQYLALKTKRGRQELPKGISLRGIGRTFGVGHNTISLMRRRLLDVNPADFSPDTCDPCTGWPQWRHVKGNAIRDRFADVPLEKRRQHLTEKMAARLGKEIDNYDEDMFMDALRLLARGTLDEAIDELADAFGNFSQAKATLYTMQEGDDGDF